VWIKSGCEGLLQALTLTAMRWRGPCSQEPWDSWAGFDAPGGAHELVASEQTLTGVAMIALSNKGNNVNYRLLGDLISTFGCTRRSKCMVRLSSASEE
jgi:hypothetical protein